MSRDKELDELREWVERELRKAHIQMSIATTELYLKKLMKEDDYTPKNALKGVLDKSFEIADLFIAYYKECYLPEYPSVEPEEQAFIELIWSSLRDG